MHRDVNDRSGGNVIFIGKVEGRHGQIGNISASAFQSNATSHISSITTLTILQTCPLGGYIPLNDREEHDSVIPWRADNIDYLNNSSTVLWWFLKSQNPRCRLGFLTKRLL